MAEPSRTDALTQPAPLPVRRRASRVPASLSLAVLLALVSFVGVLVVTKGSQGVQVAVAVRPLVAGEAVRPGDYRFSVVSASAAVTKTLFQPSETKGLDGRAATHAIPAGGLIARGDVAADGGGPQPRAISVPIDPARAVGGTLARGDVVDVVDSSGPQAVYVVTGARVLSAGDTSGSKFGGASGHYAVTVTVDDLGALRLAAAITGGKVDVVRSTGAPGAVASAPTTTVKR